MNMANGNKIPVKQINVCPEMDAFVFSFKGKCEIKTCQFHNKVTKNGCLSLDRKETSNKTITDAELKLYKCPDLKERQVFSKRRTETIRVKSLIILNSYLEWIREKFEDCGTNVRECSEKIDNYLADYPLALKELNFEDWMLKHLFDEKLYDEFYSANVKIQKNEINFTNVLGLTNKKLQMLSLEVSNIFK